MASASGPLLSVTTLGVALLLSAACMGRIGDAPSGGAASTSGGSTGGTSSSGGGNGGLSSRGSNPGTVGIHRLNAFEYDNTVNDLLGLSQSLAQTTFIPDETGTNGFDNEADALTMSDAEFQQYAQRLPMLSPKHRRSPTRRSRRRS